MIHILGNASNAPKVVTFRSRKGVTTRWWTTNGVLRWEDSTGASGEIANLRDAVDRLNSCLAMAGTSTDHGVECDAQDRRQIRRFAEELGELIAEMRRHGTPYDRLRDAKILLPGGPLSPREIASNPRIASPRKCALINPKYFE